MKNLIIPCTLLLFLVIYGSWSKNDKEAAIRAEKDRKLEMLENVFGTGVSASGVASPKGNGSMIPRAEYQPCLDSFVAVMATYGITSNNPPVPIKTFPKMTYRITTGESLQGSGLLAFIQAVIAKYDPDGNGANLNFTLRSGICTAKFVADLGQDAAITGRISNFIVPSYRTTDAAKAVKAKRRQITGGDPGDNGYELGGLEP